MLMHIYGHCTLLLAEKSNCTVANLKSKGWTFQQDGAPCHSTRKVIKYLIKKINGLLTRLPQNAQNLDFDGGTFVQN